MPTINNYTASGNISVFPCGNRQGQDIQARLNTEYNLVSIINKLVDMKSFCVTSSVSDKGQFLFNVGGYLFSVANVDDLKDKLNDSGKSYLYAGICVGKRGNLYELLPLKTSDDDTNTNIDMDMGTDTTTDDVFVGVTFISHNTLIAPGEQGEGWISSTDDIFNNIKTTAGATDIEKYILPILYKNISNKFSVPQVSLVKMATTKDGERRSVTIDDGELL